MRGVSLRPAGSKGSITVAVLRYFGESCLRVRIVESFARTVSVYKIEEYHSAAP